MKSLHFSLQHIIIGLLIISTSLFAQENWEQLSGPFGGDVLCIDHEGDNYIIGTSGGGVFFSSNLSGKWINVSDGLPFLKVDNVLIHQSKIFAAKKGEGFFMSDDFGKTWSALNTNNGLPSFMITSLVKLDDKIYCSIFGSGIFVSTDNGSSWDAKNQGLVNYNVNSLTVYNNSIYAATQTGAYLSEDFGNTWNKIRNTNYNLNLIAIKDKDIFIATNLVVMHSSNNGLDWSAAPSSVGIGRINSMITLGPYIILGRDSGLYVSTYAWNVWTNIYSSLENKVVKNLHLVGNNIFACTQYGLFVSDDYGYSWSAKSEGIQNQIITKILAVDDKIYAGTARDGIFLSKDKGKTWDNMNLGHYGIIDLVIKGKELFVLSTEGIYSTTNDGIIWEYRDSGLEDRIQYNMAVNDEDLYIGTDRGLYRSTNNGWRWDKVSPILETHRINSIYINSEKTIYVASESNIYVSTNNGDNWKVTNYGMDNLSTLNITGNDTILVVGTYPEKQFPAVIYISYDNGKTWVPSDRSWSNQYVSSVSISGLNIFANIKSTDNAEDVGVLFSSNNGKTWHSFNTGLFALNINSLTTYNGKTYAATNGTGIFQVNVPPLFPAVDLIFPVNKAKNLIINPIMDWGDADDFDFYALQISTKEEKFDRHLILDTNITSSQFQLFDSLLQNDMTYYWRVRVIKGTRESDWSDIFSFTTEKKIITKANLLTPENNSDNIPVIARFTWDKLTDATDYYLQVSTSRSFTSNAIDIIVPDTNYIAPKGKLHFTTSYYWRVKAKIHGYDREWSEISSFTTEELHLNPPQLLSPKNNADTLTLNVVLIWSVVPNADKYLLQLSSEDSFTDLLIDYTISDTSYKIPDNILDYKSDYYWRVKALLNDSSSEFSDVRKFSTMQKVGINDRLTIINKYTIAPNPVYNFANIYLTIKKPATVKFTLYNSLGKKLEDIFNSRIDRGKFDLQLNTDNLINGVYFIKINADNEYKILKFILNR